MAGAVSINVSVKEEHHEFLEAENKSPSALLQEKIDEEIERLGWDGR